MNSTKHYAYWPDALPRDTSRDGCYSECFGNKSQPYSSGKSEKDLGAKINMSLEEMCFVKKNSN